MSALILVVDDDSAIRDVLREILVEEGFEVATANNGREALDWLRRHPRQACLILLDLMMPVMTGREFLEAQQADPSIVDVPVVVITASGTDERAQIAHDYKLKGCLMKPVSLPALLAAIGGACQPHSRIGAPPCE